MKRLSPWLHCGAGVLGLMTKPSFLDKLGLAKFPAGPSQTIGTLQESAAFVFSCVAEQKMTLRELAEATGLTQVSPRWRKVFSLGGQLFLLLVDTILAGEISA